MNLYEMSRELEVINDQIITADGEITPDLESRLDAVSLDFRAKSHGIAKWTLELTGTSELIDMEIARLHKKKRAAENLRTRLMEYVKSCMETADVQKIELPTVTIRIQKNPASVEVVDETKLPASYIRIKQVTEVDKKAILSALKNGDDIPGARLIDNKTQLRIV